jgi:hypothetical protein
MFDLLIRQIRQALLANSLISLTRDSQQALARRPQLPAVAQEAAQEMNLKLAMAEVRQQAIGIKTRSALSAAPTAAHRPALVGFFVFVVIFAGLSVLLAIHVFVRRERDVLTWLVLLALVA